MHKVIFEARDDTTWKQAIAGLPAVYNIPEPVSVSLACPAPDGYHPSTKVRVFERQLFSTRNGFKFYKYVERS